MTKLITVSIYTDKGLLYSYSVYDSSLDSVYADACATYPEATTIIVGVDLP